jgi:hypothetical protein
MTTMVKEKIDASVKAKLEDILFVVSWREIARGYFGKSSSWLYHKLDGIDGNGGVGGFTEEEKQKLQGALYDLSRRIRRTADSLTEYGELDYEFPPAIASEP